MSDAPGLSPRAKADLWRKSRQSHDTGNELLKAGLAVGAIGAAGALVGAVCPLCVVATPTLLGLGTVAKLRAMLLGRSAARPAVALDPGDASQPATALPASER